jgi:HPt (histidine-containing phosphotransfer) domain-containing protein
VAEVPDEDLTRALDGLRGAYRVKLTEKLARLGSLVGEARKLRDPDKLQAARDLAHMLKGTSGSYGFDECSAALSRVEEDLERLADGAPANAAAAWLEIEQALERARSDSS